MLRPVRLVRILCTFPKKFTGNVISKLQDIGIVHLIRTGEINGFKPVKLDNDEYNKLPLLLKRTNSLIKLIESRTLKPVMRKFFGPMYVSVSSKDYDDLGRLVKQLKQLETKYMELKYVRTKINISDYNQLLIFRDVINDKLDRLKALQLFSESKFLMLFQGWVQHDKVERVKNVINIATEDKSAFEVHNPKPDEDPPTLLRNLRMVKPFEIFTEYYGTPGYKEIDPTFIIAFSFTFIFGLMFADIGYGLSLVVLSIFAYFYTTKESMFRRNLNLVLVYFGLSSMFFGFLVGEFFGIHFRKGVLDPVNDILLFLIISVLIGLVHMSIGILSKILTNIKDKKNLIHALSLLLVMWSAFSIYFQRDLVLNKILLGIGILGLLIIKKFEILKELSSVLVGAVSYMRIAILGLGHLIINRLLISSFSNLSGSLIEISLFLILFFIGSLIVLTFGVFVAAIQVLRLHWLEFYSQFFIGKGKKFEAFKHSVF
ncbi:hypothetical protein CMO83_01540 [Candidatus Woesearchaeota archaeon]|jgi:V/A-type H+-transporting ATPase subunit I|nr:hypothetical protein [Candidatus Woesearchaeota archaeon]MDP6647997.1 V-type ATPase 116kDa subunit family protein [Candidatus Woesearchaeota archaeon]|tara:strand:+ start:34466 stop:35923 length:1458 start_codon:yes stop_codon:yes gene_type:complete